MFEIEERGGLVEQKNFRLLRQGARDHHTLFFAADAAMKILGAYGYSTEFPVERYYRDAKSYQIVEGSSNVQKMIIAQDALGYRKANRA